MDRIIGLKEYVKSRKYREALGLPREVSEEYSMLAQGEYNINYLFTHPVNGQKLLLRVNCGSQMHLKNQIEYEYHALKLLEGSGRTPKALYVDGSLECLSHGVMVMEFLPGTSLDYRTDLAYAATCLADIHSVKLDSSCGLLSPENPWEAVLNECEEMVKIYMESTLGRKAAKERIRRMLDAGGEMIRKVPVREWYHCCINTELNSTNFLINGDNGTDYLIDWEKPLYGDPAQDIGHFLAPTTTFWKTDVILTKEEMEAFIDAYIQAVDGRFDTEGLKERVNIYIPVTCLRGVTWCAMAWVQYQQPDKMIFNESTYKKLEAYLSDEFLDTLA